MKVVTLQFWLAALVLHHHTAQAWWWWSSESESGESSSLENDSYEGHESSMSEESHGSSSSDTSEDYEDYEDDFEQVTDVTPEYEPCTVGGHQYEAGEQFLHPDGCNFCTCAGVVRGQRLGYICTKKACLPSETPATTEPPATGCYVRGEILPVGTAFVAEDDCNTCVCNPGDQISCTDMECVEY